MNTLIPAIGFGLVTASILAIAAVGFTLQFGVTNVFNLAYGDIMTASVFVAYVCNKAGANIWIGLLAGTVFGALFSTLLNRIVYTPFVRHGTRLFGMVIVTISVSLIIQNGLQAIWGPKFFSFRMSRGRTFHLGQMVFTVTQLEVMAIAVAAMFFIHALLRYTKLGKAMRATATNPVLARSCGIATDRVTDLAWLISGAMCGLAGVALVMNLSSFTSTTGGTFLPIIVASAILGGVGQPYGAMLGALTIGLATEVAASVFAPAYKDVVAFVILVLVLLFRPQGILSEIAVQKEVVA
jgi:branched-chain amino acid transport system permease protein/neutral amino acid transport system permease protein